MSKKRKIELTPAELAAPITRENFARRGEYYIEHVLKTDDLPVIKPDSEAWDVWREYFERHLGWWPWALREIIEGKREAMTVLCEFPQYFDKDFAERYGWKPAIPVKPFKKPNEFVDRSNRPTCEELKAEYEAKYGSAWGLQTMDRDMAAEREKGLQQVERANKQIRAVEFADAGMKPEHDLAASPSLRRLLADQVTKDND